MKEVPLNMQDCAVITLSMDAEEVIGMCHPLNNRKAQPNIDKYVAQLRAQDDVDDEVIGQIATLWGMTIITEFGWNWIGVDNEGEHCLALADKERRFTIFPIQYFARLIQGDEGRLNPPSTLFFAIERHDMPNAQPGQLLLIAN